MPQISNVQLTIQKGGCGTERLVCVEYDIIFQCWEIDCRACWVETVALWGDDRCADDACNRDWMDDFLTILQNQYIRADRQRIHRRICRNVNRSLLDEDKDVVQQNYCQVIRIPNRDEIYAKVDLTLAGSYNNCGYATARSNTVVGEWGAAGND